MPKDAVGKTVPAGKSARDEGRIVLFSLPLHGTRTGWRLQLPQGHREVSFQRLWATDTNQAVAVEEGKDMTDTEPVYLGQVTQRLWALGSEPTRMEF